MTTPSDRPEPEDEDLEVAPETIADLDADDEEVRGGAIQGCTEATTKCISL